MDGNTGGLQGDSGNTIEILWKSMEVRNKNPIGPLVVEFLKQNQTGLYNYLMKKIKSSLIYMRIC